jgi:hypothetical protein
MARPGRVNAKRGRPKIAWHNDEDRHAVAYLEMTVGTSKRGRFPSVRNAAMRAASLKEGILNTVRMVSGAPPQQLAPTGRRNSPVHPALKDGYRELDISHVDRRQGALANCALRLRRKHRTWSKNSAEGARMHKMAQAWAAATYPHAVRRQLNQEPTAICQAAAQAAGETEFFEKVLLPNLQAQERDEENRLHCQSVSVLSLFVREVPQS